MLYSQPTAFISFIIMDCSRRTGHLADTAFYMYIARINYVTFMFYQGKMVVTLENSALDFDSINLHIYFYTYMTSKFGFWNLHF